jgi:nicotinate-nucleotide pyrophosphorylase (carboxylating)
MQRLSGVATLTARYVDLIKGSKATIVDTRKTSPGMRVLEKAAVRNGGGRNHRFGLSDGVLIKDNHLTAIGGEHRVHRAVRAARAAAPHTMKIEVEVTNLADLREAIDAGADIVLLDNMDLDTLSKAVEITGGKVLLEASGGINLETVTETARTGVDLISVGALTHSAPSLDLSLDFELR